jgi:F0F1-type ATP synthase membrane subunit c/vacuolar-type H+-ATPase subunit K
VALSGLLVASSETPGKGKLLLSYAILGFALTEAIALLGFMWRLIAAFYGK